MPVKFRIVPPTESGVSQPLDFADWHSPAPSLVSETGRSFTKPGADSVGIQKTGRHKPAFEAVLESHWPSFDAALDALTDYRKIPLTGNCQLTWGGREWAADYSMEFVAMSMDLLNNPEQVVYLLSADYNYPFGAKLITRWTFQPVEV